ncbi:hypothetical protein BB561_004198 [Smittium simulii]|uniref:Uncharacterized protein n=1 Tax=Smittium simulii TaxID=133385 RepID=A0A2T9YHK5_9FUNG|nr:hypothetical protein BB561_004198 [Smittium simulii]
MFKLEFVIAAKSTLIYYKIIVSKHNAHEDAIWSVISSNTSNRIITSSVDECIKIWCDSTGKLLGLIKDLDFAFVSIDLDSTETKLISTNMGHFIEIWDISTCSLINRIQAGPLNAWKAIFVNGDRNAVTGTGKGTLLLWDLNTDETNIDNNQQKSYFATLDTTKNHHINAISSDSNNTVFAANDIGCVYSFDLKTNQLISEFTSHSDIVRALCVEKDSNILYSCSDDKRIIAYDLRFKNSIMSLQAHESWVTNLSLSQDQNLLLSSSADSTVKLWDIRGKSVVQSYSKHKSEVWDVSWKNSVDSKFISVGEDAKIIIYEN